VGRTFLSDAFDFDFDLDFRFLGISVTETPPSFDSRLLSDKNVRPTRADAL
jgi:hypothetical protein